MIPEVGEAVLLFRLEKVGLSLFQPGFLKCPFLSMIPMSPSGGADSKGSAEEVEEQRLSDAHAHSGGSCGTTGSPTKETRACGSNQSFRP